LGNSEISRNKDWKWKEEENEKKKTEEEKTKGEKKALSERKKRSFEIWNSGLN
jgi:hypothetical protein